MPDDKELSGNPSSCQWIEVSRQIQ